MSLSSKKCSTCGAVYAPTSGAQKWCVPCRELRRGEATDIGAALAAQNERKAMFLPAGDLTGMASLKAGCQKEGNRLEQEVMWLERTYRDLYQMDTTAADSAVMESAGRARTIVEGRLNRARLAMREERELHDLAELLMKHMISRRVAERS